jgi:hypothetical protein
MGIGAADSPHETSRVGCAYTVPLGVVNEDQTHLPVLVIAIGRCGLFPRRNSGVYTLNTLKQQLYDFIC